MEAPPPPLTVVLPVRDGGEWLAPAIESIRGQSFTDWELLAIDDGSRDGSRQVLEGFAARDGRIVVSSRPNRGLAATLQEGIERARSDLVAVMNADDVALPGRLAAQIAHLAAHPRVAALGTQTRLLVDGRATDVVSRLPLDPEGCRKLLDVAPPMAHPTVMFRRSVVLSVGGYRRAVPAEDYDLWLRIAEHHDLANLPDVHLEYRLHGKQSGTAHESLALATLVVRRCAAERRAGRPDPLDAPGAAAIDPGVAAALGIGPAEIARQVRVGAVSRAEQILAATGSGDRAARELDALEGGWTASVDPGRFRAARDWLAGRALLARGEPFRASLLLARAIVGDPALGRRLAGAALRRSIG